MQSSLVSYHLFVRLLQYVNAWLASAREGYRACVHVHARARVWCGWHVGILRCMHDTSLLCVIQYALLFTALPSLSSAACSGRSFFTHLQVHDMKARGVGLGTTGLRSGN